MNNIYKKYKERLIEISGKNRSLFSKRIGKQYSYDIGKLLKADADETKTFLEFLLKGNRTGYTLISKEFKDRIAYVTDAYKKVEAKFLDKEKMSLKESRNENLRRERIKRDEIKKALLNQINSLKILKREVEEFAKETGRYEMFVGYPFVQGELNRETLIKAPLLLFPMEIVVRDEFTIDLEFKKDEPIQLNKVFILAYAKHHKLIIDDLVQEFDNSRKLNFKNVSEVVTYLKKFGFKLDFKEKEGFEDFELGGLPVRGEKLSIKNYCVIGRFPLANSIYNDYDVLEKKNLSTPAIELLLNSKEMPKAAKVEKDTFPITESDYAQERSLNEINESGNVVIFGPPGTGKSQSIVNIISDSVAKGKRVLVVSQKKVAMDVVYNRLGILANKSMYITDVEKSETTFYEKVKRVHNEVMNSSATDRIKDHLKNKNDIAEEVKHLQELNDVLFTPLEYGTTLQELYMTSKLIDKGSFLYEVYTRMLENKYIMSLNYATLRDVTTKICEKKKDKLYFRFETQKKKNIFTKYLNNGINIQDVNNAKAYISGIISATQSPFDYGRYGDVRALLSYAVCCEEDRSIVKEFIKILALAKFKETEKKGKAKGGVSGKNKKAFEQRCAEYENAFYQMKADISEYVKENALLKKVLTEDGYCVIVENIINGNKYALKQFIEALDNYATIKDMEQNLLTVSEEETAILKFAYGIAKTEENMCLICSELLSIRNYHEIVKAEEKQDSKLSYIIDFENTKKRIVTLKTQALEVNKNIAYHAFDDVYRKYYNSAKNSKDYLYVINKQEGMWTVRKTMDYFADYLISLFPCWLLSPENVSSVMPLRQNLFDIIVFDEASQIFIENSIPTIFRGKQVAIAGDRKQLKPTATFMKRYIGNENFDDLSLTEQAALEVESLLDLATSRYSNAHLTYHYRSKYEELINFSNYAFYDEKLQVSPNVSRNVYKPIERIKVNGKWEERHNHAEAVEVVKTIKRIFAERDKNQTIGVITFNTEQEHYIADIIDIECENDPAFKEAYLKEANRKDEGEDTGLFIKNIENVQGEERDIIIFSVGYAKNERGKVVAAFGPLSMEGGENRLNVAITRAREKIFLITSIEPEDLNVAFSKNLGPKIFKKYLQYARAVNYGNKYEQKIILESLRKKVVIEENKANAIQEEIKNELIKRHYDVDTDLGSTKYKINLAIYNKKLDRYVLGIEIDYSANESSESMLERDVYRTKFLTSRGWNIMRLWSRDWWTDKEKTLDLIKNKVNKAIDKIKEEGVVKRKKRVAEKQVEYSVDKKLLGGNVFEKAEKEEKVISSRISKKILARIEDDKINQEENEEIIKNLNENPDYSLVVEPLMTKEELIKYNREKRKQNKESKTTKMSSNAKSGK